MIGLDSVRASLLIEVCSKIMYKRDREKKNSDFCIFYKKGDIKFRPDLYQGRKTDFPIFSENMSVFLKKHRNVSGKTRTSFFRLLFYLFRYSCGLSPVCRLKYLPKNDILVKFSE